MSNFDRKFSASSARHLESSIGELKKLNERWMTAGTKERKELQAKSKAIRSEIELIGGLSEKSVSAS